MFIALLNTKRRSVESFKDFESRFDAQVSRFNASSDSAKLPTALTAFMLLANSSLDASQRVSVLAASSPSESSLGSMATTDQFLDCISYSSVASILRQCDQVKDSEKPASSSTSPLSALSASNGYNQTQNRVGRGRRTLSPEQLSDLKSRSTCHKCEQKGHWHSDHNPDGSLKPGIKTIPDKTIPLDNSTTAPKKSITFNMVQLTKNFKLETNSIGPLLDDGAPYSGMGLDEFNLLQPIIYPTWDGELLPLPKEIEACPYWQYGTGQHSSESRKILGSVILKAKTDQDSSVFIRHLIIDGSSQWVVGRNVTKYCNIVHIGGNKIVLPDTNDSITLTNVQYHSHIPYCAFIHGDKDCSVAMDKKLFCATATIANTDIIRPWNEVKKVIDKVHKHICGHSNYSDIRILLERNKLWCDEAKKYLCSVLENCPSCETTAKPSTARKVSLSSMSRDFNCVVCVDHFFLDAHCVFHLMDSVARYSAGDVVSDVSMKTAIPVIESQWISPFWTPKAILFDPAFDNEPFREYLGNHDIEPRPIPPRRHNKNVIESKHRIIRDIYLRLKSTVPDCTEDHQKLLIQQALRISNDLYGTDVCSAHELAKGYTRPIASGEFPATIPEEILNAHHELIAKRRLTLILRSKSITDIPLHVGDQVQIYIKQQHEKRGKWSSPKVAISFDSEMGTVTVPGKNGRFVRAALEDVRPAITESNFALTIQEAIDSISTNLEDSLDEFLTEETDIIPKVSLIECPPSSAGEYDNGQDDLLTALPGLCDHVDIYWPLDDQ